MLAGWRPFTRTRWHSFDELEYEKPFVRPRQIRGAADLLIDGKLVPWPFGREAVNNSTLLTELTKPVGPTIWLTWWQSSQSNSNPILAFDRHNAEEEFAPLGHNLVEYMLRILFEGPWFARMNTMSAAMARTWLCALEDARFFQVRGGMDAPWLKLAERLNVRTGERVESLRQGSTVDRTDLFIWHTQLRRSGDGCPCARRHAHHGDPTRSCARLAG